MKDTVKQLDELIWELKLWVREGDDAREIVTKIMNEIVEVIEKFKQEGGDKR